MTYMNESHLSSTTSSANTDAEPSTVEKLKTLTQEGTERSKRILNILRQAFSETREEFQAGRTIISPLAQEVTTETVSTFKEKGQQAAEAVNKAWKDEANAPDVTDRASAFLKTITKAAKEQIFPTLEQQVKQQASKLDDVLDHRYGEQYTTIKHRLESIRHWVIDSQPTDEKATEQTTMETIATETASAKAEGPEPSIVIEVNSEVIQ